MQTASSTASVPNPALPLAVTMGDPAGIGPDVTLASWQGRRQLGLPPFAVYGADEKVLEQRARMLGLVIPIAPIASIRDAHRIFADAIPIVRRSQVPLGGVDGAIVAAIEDATAAVVAGEALALVTNPIAKRT